MRDFLRTTLLACVMSLCLVVPGTAGPWEDGLAAYQRGDHATALRLWRKAAEQGHALAQYFLGLAYANGEGVPQDYGEAHKWSNLTAAQGVKSATKNRDILARKMTPAQIAEA